MCNMTKETCYAMKEITFLTYDIVNKFFSVGSKSGDSIRSCHQLGWSHVHFNQELQPWRL